MTEKRSQIIALFVLGGLLMLGLFSSSLRNSWRYTISQKTPVETQTKSISTHSGTQHDPYYERFIDNVVTPLNK